MIEETLLEAGDKMDKAVEVAKEDFASIRTGRATPGLYNKVLVDYYGSPTPLQQLASFTAPEARIILIQPYDLGAMPAVERAIRDSDLGVNPSNDGRVLRCVFPELTEAQQDEVVAALLRMMGQRKPVVLVLEDVHWADEATLDVLRMLGRRIEEGRGLVLASYRDDDVEEPLRSGRDLADRQRHRAVGDEAVERHAEIDRDQVAVLGGVPARDAVHDHRVR